MPKTTYPVVFRAKFIEGLDEREEPFREYCARFGISHETGYDWLSRVERSGLDGLVPRSSAPHVCPHATSLAVQELLIAGRKAHPTWGPRKLRAWLIDVHPRMHLPAPSTIGDILNRAGMVMSRRRRKHAWPSSRPFASAVAPNDVWTADFKGQFRTADGEPCYPLTVADSFSRYLLRCDACAHPTEEAAKAVFTAAFREYGLPSVIHSDNGSPFAATTPGGLSRLSVWWIHLGILPERSRPATPSDNGRHERMHRTLKAEATKPPRTNLRQQQRALNTFRDEYNTLRPHEALGQVPPTRFYTPSSRPFPRHLPEIDYPSHAELRKIDVSGHFRWRGDHVFLSAVLAHEQVALVAVDDGAWDVYFGPVLLGSLSTTRPDLGLLPPPRP